ncbi:MAG TPA: hypothetical protein VHF01_09200 [Candidatus Acidoferrum sp.]|nr:hypothetical protein [Candidatus Acidoferrum sp.]
MKPESPNPVIDQEFSRPQSVQLAPGETSANESQARNEDSPRCAFRFANRHQCRFGMTLLSAPYCHQHSSFRPDDPDSINLAPALLGDLTELTTAADMQTTLSKLFILLAQNRVTTKKASVLTYIIQQLLRTLPAIYQETHGDDDHVTIIMDGPRPIRD